MSDPAATVSVVVCTRDRPVELVRCLASLVREGATEVLVVDNASADPDRVLRAAATVGARVVVEPCVGLSAARNLALTEAVGEVVLFIDDDATAAPGLVAAHADAYRDDAVVAAGGVVSAVFPPPGRPTWLDPSLDGYLSSIDLGPEPRHLRAGETPHGGNLSVRRTTARDVGGFDLELGRRDRDLVSGEEIDLISRLTAVGGRARWCPAATVAHHINPDRLRVRWFLRRAHAQGRTDVALRRRRADVRRTADLLTAGRRLGSAVRPGGATVTPAGPHRAARRVMSEAIWRVRLLSAAGSLIRRP